MGREWKTEAAVTVNGDTELLGVDPSRGGLIIYPHATIDIYISISGATATGTVGEGMEKIPSGASGNTTPLSLLGDDAPTNAVRAYTASSASVRFRTRKAARP